MEFQHSNFSSKAISKIIAEVEAKKTLFTSAVPGNFFADVIEQKIPSAIFESYFCNIVLFK